MKLVTICCGQHCYIQNNDVVVVVCGVKLKWKIDFYTIEIN